MPDYGPQIDSFRHLQYLISGQRTATVTIKALDVPWACRVANPKANARASGGTSPTLTVDLKVSTTSKLASAMSVTAGTWTAGSPASDPSLAAGDDLDIVLTIGGTSPTWDDIVVEFDLVRT